jgi:hypothetical protein
VAGLGSLDAETTFQGEAQVEPKRGSNAVGGNPRMATATERPLQSGDPGPGEAPVVEGGDEFAEPAGGREAGGGLVGGRAGVGAGDEEIRSRP